jgi:hypothetical protein
MGMGEPSEEAGDMKDALLTQAHALPLCKNQQYQRSGASATKVPSHSSDPNQAPMYPPTLPLFDPILYLGPPCALV